MARHDVCATDEVAPGRLTPVKIGRATVVLARLPDGRVRAFAGRCPHQGAPLEHGCIAADTAAAGGGRIAAARAGELLRCPWHGFEWDLLTGAPLVAEPQGRKMRLRFLEVEEEDGRVIVLV